MFDRRESAAQITNFGRVQVRVGRSRVTAIAPPLFVLLLTTSSLCLPLLACHLQLGFQLATLDLEETWNPGVGVPSPGAGVCTFYFDLCM